MKGRTVRGPSAVMEVQDNAGRLLREMVGFIALASLLVAWLPLLGRL